MTFESKFCLPKKVPVFLCEFVGFMETHERSINNAVAQGFLEALPASWCEYVKCTRVRKTREKKEETPAPPATEAVPAIDSKKTVLDKLYSFISVNVKDEGTRNELVQLIGELVN
jgi:hypothetical protein